MNDGLKLLLALALVGALLFMLDCSGEARAGAVAGTTGFAT